MQIGHTRTFPQGTFVPTPLRVVAIMHLCIAFSALLFDMGYPFMGQLFEHKRLKHVYESVIHDTYHFKQLPLQKQVEIRDSHQHLLERMQQPFLSKAHRSFSILLIDLPPFEKAWLFFSIAIPLLILLKIEGAHRTAWILPLITLISIGNQLFFYPNNSDLLEPKLFPSETTLLEQYLKQPLAPTISDQREQLLKGWHLYVIDHWAQEAPALEEQTFKKQLSKGLFAFNAARIDAICRDSCFPACLRKKGGIFMMGLLIWNIFFAWYANRGKWYTD